jgi:hypothetical protein
MEEERGMNPKIVDWESPGRIDKLKEMWAIGYSAVQIADALGIPGKKNAVIGKSNRLNLGAHPNGHAYYRATERARRLKERTESKAKRHREMDGSISRSKSSGPVRKRKPPKPDVVIEKVVERRASIDGPSMKPDYRFQRSKAWEALEGSKPVSLVDLKKGQCGWPVGIDSPYHFCALPVDADGRYCASHHYLAHPKT